jgi:hypothetical protein
MEFQGITPELFVAKRIESEDSLSIVQQALGVIEDALV